MRNYIYKVLVLSIALIVIFEFTIGKHINNFNQQLDTITTKDGRKKMVNSIKKEIKKANEKENYLSEEERVLMKNFINKIKKELDLNN